MKELISISPGNSKMGVIPSVSLPPIVTCPDNVPCATDERCYVIKHMKFGIVVNAFARNYRIYLDDPDRYFRQILGYIHRNEPEYFRFHVGGDIPDQEYYDQVVKLCNIVPTVKIMLMTKAYMDEHYYEWIERGNTENSDPSDYTINFNPVPDNLSVIISAWPGYPIPPYLKNTFPIAYMDDGTEERISKNDKICKGHCDECHYCWHAKHSKRNIIFELH